MTRRHSRTGTCPHCKIRVRFEPTRIFAGKGDRGTLDPLQFTTLAGFKLEVVSLGCPGCGRPIVMATRLLDQQNVGETLDSLLWPDTGARPVPSEVQNQAPSLAADFREAVSVFPKSKKASAALSRRCLQYILHEKAGTKSKDLSTQIDEVLNVLPSELASNVDAIRHW